MSICNYVLKINSSDNIREFICIFDKSCINNAEFFEYYNESLFIVLEQNPFRFIETLSLFDKNKISQIVGILEAPINDSIDVSKIIDLVNIQKFNTHNQKKTKQMILKSLFLALKKT